jgi:type I restriction enzyme R subunit
MLHESHVMEGNQQTPTEIEHGPYGESDTRAKLIDPKLHERGWTEEHIRREQTPGGIEIVNGIARRLSRKHIDYVLRVKVSHTAQPVAVAYVEAKAENRPAEEGLQQVKDYATTAERLHVPFVFSTNGHLFIEYNHVTGQTSGPKALTRFPTPSELRARYEAALGFSLESEAAKPLLQPYAGGEATRRYYQDAAIRAVLETVARGKNRALLSLATGAGKTFIAAHLLKRISDAGLLKRALFVCDRDELRTQAVHALSNVFGSDAAEVCEDAEGRNNARNARVHIATYQTLDVDSEEAKATFLLKHYPDGAFSHIIIDECHRSAWGKWHEVLKRNPDAVQIGLTATPRQLILSARKQREREMPAMVVADDPEAQDPLLVDEKILADNIHYFGEPVYEYDLSQGIEDGYLAPPEIFAFDLFHDNKTIPERLAHIPREDFKNKPIVDVTTQNPVNYTQLKPRIAQAEIDEQLFIVERTQEVARHWFEQLIALGDGPEQKTILFCASDLHADRMANELNTLYRDWCAAHRQQPKAFYAFKCTAKGGGSKALIADLRGSASSHFLACTVELLSTGVDVPCVCNLVFIQYIRSPIVFYQMLGRGTRLDPDTGKLMFRVYDYTDATGLLGSDFRTKFTPKGLRGPRPPGPPPPPPKQVEGVQIIVKPEGRYLVATVDGRDARLTVEEYRQRIAARLLDVAPDVGAFRQRWVHPDARAQLLAHIVRGGVSPRALQMAEDTGDCDLYDVLGELGYGLLRLTRADRAYAFTWKQKPWLAEMPTATADTVKAIASQFSRAGTEGLETPEIFNAPEVRRAGGLDALKLFGKPADLLVETKERLFAA